MFFDSLSKALSSGFVSFALLLGVVSCSGAEPEDSESKYIVLSDPYLIKYAKAPSISINVTGAADSAGAQRQAMDENLRRSVRTWLDALQPNGQNIVRNVNVGHCSDPTQFEAPGCVTRKRVFDPDTRTWSYELVPIRHTLQVIVHNTLNADGSAYRENYSIANRTLHLTPSSSFETILHEMGHAFGLADTYAEGGWFCDIHHGRYAPTSKSVMCNANFAALQPDDIAGIQHLYCSTFPADCSRGVLTVEWNSDRAGQDYTSFDLPSPDYRICYDRCASDNACRAYTYVPVGIQGPQARCWLKNGIPALTSFTGMVSGYKP